MSVAFGNSFDWGELGVKYWTENDGDDSDLSINYRTDFGFWLFDNTVVSVSDIMCEDCDMAISADFFSHMDVGGADLVYAWGIDQGGSNAELTQTATVGIEANMTDWATLRAGYNWAYQLSGDDEVVGNLATDGFTYGLGFNWGGLTADFYVNSALLLDPVGTITGNNDDGGGLTDGTITLTYSF